MTPKVTQAAPGTAGSQRLDFGRRTSANVSRVALRPGHCKICTGPTGCVYGQNICHSIFNRLLFCYSADAQAKDSPPWTY